MRRRRTSATEGSLDSLLDTMTNVVGILVILLAVTQLGVGDAVKRILRTQAGDPNALNISEVKLDVAKDQARELDELLEQLRSRWKDLGDSIIEQREQLEQIQKIIEDLKREIREKPDAKVDSEQVRKTIDQRQKEASTLADQIAAAEKELAKLKALLEKTPEYHAPAPKIVTLPDPRPAPPGMESILYLCREGRIIPVDLETLQKVALSGIRRATGASDEKEEIDCAKLVEFFDARSLGDKYFRIRIRIHNYRPYMMLESRPTAGETVEQMIDPTSDFQRTIRRTNKEKYYVRFLVWPDSFDVYIEARAIVTRYDMLAGWEPRSSSSEFSDRVDTQVVCEGRPAPKPVTTKTAPPPQAGDDNNAAKRKPPPVDTID